MGIGISPFSLLGWKRQQQRECIAEHCECPIAIFGASEQNGNGFVVNVRTLRAPTVRIVRSLSHWDSLAQTLFSLFGSNLLESRFAHRRAFVRFTISVVR